MLDDKKKADWISLMSKFDFQDAIGLLDRSSTSYALKNMKLFDMEIFSFIEELVMVIDSIRMLIQIHKQITFLAGTFWGRRCSHHSECSDI